jgi:hypothetical protein
MAGGSVTVTPWPGSDSQTYASGAQIMMVCSPTYTGYPEPGLWRPDLWEGWLA